MDAQVGPDLLLESSGYPSRISFHQWFGRRPDEYALIAAAFALADESVDRDALTKLVRERDYFATKDLLDASREERLSPPTLVDLCSGVGTLAASAAALGCSVTAIEQQPIPVAINRVLNDTGVDSSLVVPDGKAWLGLDDELRGAAQVVLDLILGALHEKATPRGDRLWARISPCPSCQLLVPLVRTFRHTTHQRFQLLVDDSDTPKVHLTDRQTDIDTWRRGEVDCPRCHTKWTVRPVDTVKARALLQRTQDGRFEAINDVTTQLAAPAPLWSSDEERIQANGVTWAWLQGPRILPDDAAMLPSHHAFVQASEEALASLQRRLSDRTGMPEGSREALLLACTLLITAQTVEASVLAEWRHDRVLSALSRHVLTLPPMFGERGTITIEQKWTQRLEALLDSWQQARERGVSPVRVIQGDAGSTGLPTRSADAVLWDPAVYDNIDYGALARPFEFTFARVAGELVSILGQLSFPALPSALILKRPLQRTTADHELMRQAEEARRLVRPTGRIAVYWHARDREDLQRFLDLISPTGLTLERATRVQRPSELRLPSDPSERGTYLLLFRPVGEAAASSRSMADAARVLDLADHGQASLYEGLAEVLNKHWEEVDLAAYIPTDFKGSRLQRIAELVASTPDLTDLLVELGRPTLRKELQDRSGVSPAGDVRVLSELLLSQLGFAVPSSDGYSISKALSAAQISLANLSVTRSRGEAIGEFQAIAAHVENVLQFSVVAWSMHIARNSGGREEFDGWEDVVRTAVEQETNPKFDVNRLSMGIWQRAFSAIPKLYVNVLTHQQIFKPIANGMKKVRFEEHFKPFVRTRNDLMHPPPELGALDESRLVERLMASSKPLLEALGRLNENGHLPRTLQPYEEVRDAYGRRRLVLKDPLGVRFEMFVRQETDLGQPVVYLASGSNPRDVDPVLMPVPRVGQILHRSDDVRTSKKPN